MPDPRLTLLGKPGCHLCDDARAIVSEVAAERGLEVEERNILEDERLLAQYAEEIPVLLIDDRVHTIWRVDPDRLRRALDAREATS
ncbi:glutaredoxin family protein [Homoserinibacter sp. GY 40078]|uniref:glutaredoxin family protein n=1 Tax=Homoserinibacter sp. GY 40078 TaxID=2603275 RepID=UPI0011CA62BB|nr:glutaredoxin family protein [Homoserinibacter sp. GY 40078]TXK18599.1 glutaredoxin family protein [Homoserinibacter sp. GY 40078]